MSSGLSRREADYTGFDAAIMVEGENAAETARFVIGMGGNTEQSRHGAILPCKVGTLIVQGIVTRNTKKCFGDSGFRNTIMRRMAGCAQREELTCTFL